ncbi:endo-1,4-beta-xylanase [Epithele typhae]|uniref:endo-1,4-beta-xylanase n=1 Tax=Epithele typhae TaxID=378194 RepID=UPI002007D759|nr:endo-1,4-beta-xylanase [Epithele typhae]KAH9936779.1 endo-1,4-beta-xylanase [Epithele typhae]
MKSFFTAFVAIATIVALPLDARPVAETSALSVRAATGLDKLFKAKGRAFVGTASDQGRFSNAQNSAVTLREFGSVTPENSMKWDATEPNPGQFTLSGADALVNYATTNGILVRAHTLVWHSQLPTWVSSITDKTVLTSAIQNHIATVAGRYAGKVRSWDVVNEMFNEDGSVRSSVFSNLLGTSFVDLSFAAARKADPEALLYINDFNLDSANAKAKGLVNLVNTVNANGVVIDGIGTQTHLGAGGAGGVAAAIKLLASAKNVKEVAITELDIGQAGAADYTAVVNACLAETKCQSITLWGVRDPDSWRASETPLLFDANFADKAAYTAVAKVLA